MYKCSTDNGSFGSPILNLQTNKVIGIHSSINYNIGTLLKLPIKDFINKNFMEDEKNLIIINNKEFKINNPLSFFEESLYLFYIIMYKTILQKAYYIDFTCTLFNISLYFA